MQRHLSRPVMRKGRRRPKKKKAALAVGLAEQGLAPSPRGGNAALAAQAGAALHAAIDPAPPAPKSRGSSAPHVPGGHTQSGSFDLSELKNALKRRKASSSTAGTTPHQGEKKLTTKASKKKIPSSLKLTMPKPSAKGAKSAKLSRKLSRTKSRRGFGRLVPEPLKTPKAPSRNTENSFSSSSKPTSSIATKTLDKQRWESGDIRWVRCVDETGDENFIVAKVVDSSDPERIKFQSVDWTLDDGTPVNKHLGNLSGPEKSFVVTPSDVGPRIEISSELNQTYADMTCLPAVHKATILHNLRVRYTASHFQTSIGSILCVINPFEYHSNVYGLDVVHQYTDGKGGDSAGKPPPHVYGVAQAAFRGLRRGRKNQAIIISGESGAGKTETTKKCLQYLAEVGGHSNSGTENGPSRNSPRTSVEDRILSANPVFEAFGNAKTVRNDNSSRFGKWLEILFHPSSFSVCGCQTVSYLLEKSRVVSVAPGERNYSIFYQLIAGADSATMKRMHLDGKTTQSYGYLKGGAPADTSNDHDLFHITLDALNSLGFSQNLHSVLSVVAAVLHIGNIEFSKDSNDYAQVSDTPSLSSVDKAAKCLGVDKDELALAISTKRLVIVGERTDKPIPVASAIENRDALAKGLYNSLFSSIVSQVNTAMMSGSRALSALGNVSSALRIGVLDIFGFEIFEYNSLEQLCINFANEKLQSLFNASVVEDELKTCLEEGIEAPPIDTESTRSGVVQLMEGKSPPGVMLMLDEEIRVVGGSDEGFMNKIMRAHRKPGGRKSQQILSDRPLRKPGAGRMAAKGTKGSASNCFWVRHYAGVVQYHVDGFLEKNRDALALPLTELVQTSSNPYISKLIPDDENQKGGSVSRGRRARRASSRSKKKSLLNKFRLQLSSLIATLTAADPHYIRCIKPNSSKSPRVFDPFMVSRQLNCSGLYDVVRLRKEGYPYRLAHRDFSQKFFPLLRWLRRSRKQGAIGGGDFSDIFSRNSDPADRCKAIISELTWKYPSFDEECVVGTSKVLIRELAFMWLERYLDVVRDRASRLVQRSARGKRGRDRANRLRSSKAMLQAAISSGDLGRAQEILQVARKRATANEMGMLLREAGAIENMVNQSRAKNQLRDLVKMPVSELWTQCKLLQSLVAEAQIGGVDGKGSSSEDATTIAKALELIAASKLLEKAVGNLDAAIVSGDPEALQSAVKESQELSKEHGNFCLSTLNEAKDKLSMIQNTSGGNNSKSLFRGLSRKALVDPAGATARRLRIRQEEEEHILRETERLLKLRQDATSALENLTVGTQGFGLVDSITKAELIERLANVVELVEELSECEMASHLSDTVDGTIEPHSVGRALLLQSI